MRNTILGIIALGVLGACNSDPKNEVGRYVPMGGEYEKMLDTKTGRVYMFLPDQKTGSYIWISVDVPEKAIKK